MADEIKRLHYYDQQFLREPDFTDEQKYHMDMRRRHNRTMHGWGIVEGMKVVIKDSQTVTIQAGMALDADGREIIIGQAQDIAIPGGPSNANKTYYVAVKYKSPEDLTDPPPPQDVITPADRTRVTERPDFPAPNLSLPADPSRTVVLCAVLLNASGNVLSINEGSRQYVPKGIAGKFGIGTLDPQNKLDIEGGAVIGATYSGTNIAPANGLLIEGNVGIGTASINSNASLHIKLPGTGSFDHLRIESPKNYVGFGIKLVQPNREWSISQNRENYSDGRFQISDETSNQCRLMIDATGKVGIGTTSPQNKLDIEGGAVVGATYSGTNTAPVNGLLVEGNVGIGTSALGDKNKLVVSGGRLGQLESGSIGDGWGKWSTIGVPDLGFSQTSTNYYGLKVNWDSDGVVFGLRNYGSNRKDAIIAWGDDANDNFRFLRPNDVDAMIITGGGSVGIGTTNPGYKLEVSGSTLIDGTLWTKINNLYRQLGGNPARYVQAVWFATDNNTNDTQEVNLGSARQFFAFVVMTGCDPRADFDRGDAFALDIFTVDGYKTGSWRFGGDHFGTSGSDSNIYAQSYSGYGQRILFRSRSFQDASVFGMGIVFYE